MLNYKELECIHYDSRNYTSHGAPGSYPITLAGLLIHATGEGTTSLKRYVQPSKEDPKYAELIKVLGENKNKNSWNRNVSKGVHYMLGKCADGSYAVAQMLPDNICAWGVGKGKKGSYNYNPAYMQIEIQDGNPIKETYYIAVDWAAKMCKKHGWTSKNITSHNEARIAGYGSGHTDPKAYFAKLGKTMDDFRADVQAILDADKPTPTPVDPEDIVVGDIVDFTGTQHFTNCNAAPEKAKSCKPGKAIVKSIWKGKKHPYQIKYVAGSGCTANGFVNADTISKGKPHEFQVGETIMFTGCKQYTNCNKAETGYVTAKAGTAVIKSIWKGKKHEYQLKGTSVSGYTKASVNGFVNAEDIAELTVPTKTTSMPYSARVSSNAKANWRDIVSRVAKTFVEAFVSVVLIDLQSIIMAIRDGDIVEIITPILISAGAAGISAIWNTFLTPLLNKSVINIEVEDNELEITIDDDDIEIEDEENFNEEDESGVDEEEIASICADVNAL